MFVRDESGASSATPIHVVSPLKAQYFPVGLSAANSLSELSGILTKITRCDSHISGVPPNNHSSIESMSFKKSNISISELAVSVPTGAPSIGESSLQAWCSRLNIVARFCLGDSESRGKSALHITPFFG
jgi:hypothetical protein